MRCFGYRAADHALQLRDGQFKSSKYSGRVLPLKSCLGWVLMLIPEFCPGEPRLSGGPTLPINQMRPWD